MVKHVHCTLSDSDHKKLTKMKGKLSWDDYLRRDIIFQKEM